MERGIRRWYEDTAEVVGRNGPEGLLHGLYYAYVGLWLTVTSRIPVGTNVFDRDWDALIVLDACRADALAAVADEYDFVEPVDSVRSVGSTSGEWVAHTFSEPNRAAVEETAYVTANPHTDAVLRAGNTPPQYFAAPFAWPAWDPVDPSAFAELAEVWRTDHDPRLDVTPPRAVTDRAIEVGRKSSADRLIVHYMQPHAPYVRDVVDGDSPPPAALAEPFEHLRRGELSRERAWEAYLDNLRLVLDEVVLLRENLAADDVVVTADHGEAFGELSFYEHPVGCPHPAVKRVPWVETTAVDHETYEPATTGESTADTADATASVEEQLVALGYQ